MNSPDTIGTTRRWAMLACSLIAAMTTTCVVSGIAYLIPALHAEGMSVSRARCSPRFHGRIDDGHHRLGHLLDRQANA